jgi:hypothetical protein
MLQITLIKLANSHAERNIQMAILYAQRRVALDPLQEEAHQQLMRLYDANDQKAAALRQYQICRQTLLDELGIEPDPTTQALHDQIRMHRPIAIDPPQAEEKLPPQKMTLPPRADRSAELVLLDKVYSFWIEGLFKQSLKENNPIEIEMEMVPDAVDNPWQGVLPDLSQTKKPIRPLVSRWRPATTDSASSAACSRSASPSGRPISSLAATAPATADAALPP